MNCMDCGEEISRCDCLMGVPADSPMGRLRYAKPATEPKRDEALELAEKLADAEWTVNTKERRSLTREEVAALIRPVLQAQRGVVAEEVERVAQEMEASAQRVRAILSNLPAGIDQANTKAWAESLEKSATLLRSQAREIERLKSGKE